MLEDVAFVYKFIKDSKHTVDIRFQYDLLEEARILQDIDREEKRITKTYKNKIEARERRKIAAGLDKDIRNQISTKARRKQLVQVTDELKDLNHYIESAKCSKALIAQLKFQDAELDRRVEAARQCAQQTRERFRAMEECQKQAEEESKLKGKEHGLYLRAQLDDNDARRLQDRMEFIRDGQEMRKRMLKDDEKFRKEMEAAAIAKEKVRKDSMEFLRQRAELRKQVKNDDAKFAKELYEMQLKGDAQAQQIIASKKARIQRQMEIAQRIGQEVLAINTAKEEKINNIIEVFVNEMKNRTDLLYEKEEEKAKEMRRLMQRNMHVQMAERQMKKDHQLIRTMEEMDKRLMYDSHNDSEINILRKRMERERRDNEQFLMLKALEHEERKAEEKLQVAAGSLRVKDLNDQAEIKAVRAHILHEQPISLLRYLPTALLRSDYLPEPLGERVREQTRLDPIPLFNIKRNLRHIKRMKSEGGDPVVCCKACPPPKPLSNIF